MASLAGPGQQDNPKTTERLHGSARPPQALQPTFPSPLLLSSFPLNASWDGVLSTTPDSHVPALVMPSRAGSGLQEGAGPVSASGLGHSFASTDQALRHPLGHGPFPLDPLA